MRGGGKSKPRPTVWSEGSVGAVLARAWWRFGGGAVRSGWIVREAWGEIPEALDCLRSRWARLISSS